MSAKQRFVSWFRRKTCSCSATPTDLSSQFPSIQTDFISFLATVQASDIDFLPIQWQKALDTVGEGGSAEIRQLYIDLQTSFAFKRFHWSFRNESENYQALVCEVSILGHPLVRSHPNIVRLEGVCWDISFDREEVWPVLVFEKARHGDLRKFVSTNTGDSIKWDDRVKLCADIATAIMLMHSSQIVHGDIKPENVLVFEDESGQYFAKITDFGYSTLNAGDTPIYMPKSEPWHAPEWHHRGFEILDAMKMDVFSFGMLCLWLLFYTISNTKETNFVYDLDQGTMPSALTLAHSHIRAAVRLSEESRVDLHRFFQLTLAIEKDRRSIDFKVLLSLLAPSRTLMGFGSDPIAVERLSIHEDFQILPAIYQLYQADYRLRSHIFQCLHRRVSTSESRAWSDTSLDKAAFQVAFCYKLGFGVRKNDDKSLNMLGGSVLQVEELEQAINSLRFGTWKSFHEGKFRDLYLSGRLAVTNFVDYYRFYPQWERTSEAYRREIRDVEVVLGGEHLVPMFLTGVLSAIYKNQGQFKKALEIDKQVVTRSLRVLGVGNPNTLASINNLAVTFLDLGQFKEAEDRLALLMQVCVKTLGLDNLRTIQSIHHLADTYTRQGRWDEAEKLEAQVTQMYLNRVGQERPETLDSMSNLAKIYREQGKWKEAGELHLQVLNIRKRVLGEDHPATLASLSNLATYYQYMRRWKDAEVLRLDILETRAKLLGNEHDSVLLCMADLASCYTGQERWKEAEDLQIKAVRLSHKTLGREHPDTLSYLAGLANLFISQEKWRKARKLHTRLKNLTIKVLGRKHPDTLARMGNLALVYSSMKSWRQAEKLESQVLRIRKRMLGRQHPHTISSITHLATIFSTQERWKKAETQYLQIVDAKTKALGSENPSTLISVANLATTYRKQKRYWKAKKLQTHALKTNVKVLGREHPQSLNSMAVLALTLMHLGQWRKAEALQVRLLRMNDKVLGETHPETILNVENLGDLYTATGKVDKAEKLYDKASRLRGQMVEAKASDRTDDNHLEKVQSDLRI